MRVATWNVNNVRHRLPLLLAWLDATKPDVVACIDRRALTLGKELLRRDHDFLALEPLHAGTDRLEQADEVARR